MAHPHAEVLRQITEEAEREGEYEKRFEVFYSGCWRTALDKDQLFGFVVAGNYVRQKPRTVTMTGPGGTFEYPEPMREAPQHESAVYVVDVHEMAEDGFTAQTTWLGHRCDYAHLAAGLCHNDQESATQHARALILAGGGSLDDE